MADGAGLEEQVMPPPTERSATSTLDAGAALSIDQFDGLWHCIGIFSAVLHRFEAKAGPVH